jgi:hypothetical protein
MCAKNMNTASFHNNDDKCATDCTGKLSYTLGNVFCA